MTHLEVDSRDEAGVVVIRLKGFLDAHNAPLFREAVAALDPLEGPRVVLDMGALEYTGSSGLEVILAHLGPFRHNGGDIRLAAASPRVRRVFELLGLTRHLKFFDGVDQAVASYGG